MQPGALRKPSIADGPELWHLARVSGTLDLNPSYAYLMACRNFGETSVVAEEDGHIVGFVTAYKPSGRADTIFVWQVTVDPSQRGRGTGRAMLTEILGRENCTGVRFLESNVTPSNEASKRLFRSLAEHLGTGCEEGPCFDAGLFPDGAHEEELLFRIGPFEGGAALRSAEAEMNAINARR